MNPRTVGDETEPYLTNRVRITHEQEVCNFTKSKQERGIREGREPSLAPYQIDQKQDGGKGRPSMAARHPEKKPPLYPLHRVALVMFDVIGAGGVATVPWRIWEGE